MAGYLAGNVDEWIYIDISDQHPDSIRFIKDCENAIGKEIQIISSSEYSCVKIALGFSEVSEVLQTILHHVQIG